MSCYAPSALSREELDRLPGISVVEFGTNWCGFCHAARPFIEAAFADYPDVKRFRIEDGKGLPLGRSFVVREWPTLIFLADGREVARVVRPDSTAPVTQALAELVASNQSDG